MRKSILSTILAILIAVSCLSLSGCGKVDKEYQAFYDSLVDSDGNFRFRGTEPGDSQKAILHSEELSGVEGEDITFKDSTGLFRCLIPVQFPCFSFDLYRDYKTATHIPSKDGGRFDGYLTSGSYFAFFEQEADFTAACQQVTAFLKEYFPKGNSFETLEQLPEPEQVILSPQWQAEAEDGSQLLVTFQNRISPKNPNRSPAFCSIRIEVSYHNLVESVTENYDEFYQALVNPDGNFRFRGTEPGQTYEQLAAAYEAEGYGREVLSPTDFSVSCAVPDSFPCFSFSFYKRYWMVGGALQSGSYTASFYREADFAAACQRFTAFLKAYFPDGDSFEALEQLPERGKVMSPQWEVEAPDGSKLSVTYQMADLDHPKNKGPSASSITITVHYINLK